jgi:hypothetical protein
MSILTGIDNPSRNIKTGSVIQQWILRGDINPIDAVKTGSDEAICGNCPLKGDGQGKQRSCYVNIAFAPNQIYKMREKYKPLVLRALRGAGFRFGAYGEATALPIEETIRIAKAASFSLGYTHQWRTADPEFKNYLMASCDSVEDYELAKQNGYRTFRIKLKEEPLLPTEVICPASPGSRTPMTCQICQRCGGLNGTGKKDIAIDIHGGTGKARNFERMRSINGGY